MPIELLAAAGSPEALDAAIGEGADAICLKLKDPNAQKTGAGFTYSRFEAALHSLRRMGIKLYVTIDTVFEQREADRIYQLLRYLSIAGPDALIVQDFGVIAMVRTEFPGLKIFASERMNIASGKGANALSKHGVSRVALARELGLEELRSIRTETNMELEVFVHGPSCISVSGLCLFSSYLGGKSANRGICTRACRRLYQRGGDAPESGYYFSSPDIRLLEQLPYLAAAGINSVRIEEHPKNAGAAGTAVSACRLVLDALAEGSEEKIRLSITEGMKLLKGDSAQGKAGKKRYRPIIAHGKPAGNRSPGFEKAPAPAIVSVKSHQLRPEKQGSKPLGKNSAAVFPEGLYVAVSCINDLYIVQSSRPVRVILNLNSETAPYLLGDGKPPLPFKPAEIILTLDPFFPQAAAATLAGEIKNLAGLGYRQFIANNLGHFSLFRTIRSDIRIIAGPWLYLFNAWALSFIASMEVDGFVPPLENNRQNLERTLNAGNHSVRSSFFIPVFAWPPLFNIRSNSAQAYSFSSFPGNRNENFSLFTGANGSQVFPEKPFSIIDKIPFLKEAGFRRFIIYLSGPPLKKPEYRNLMHAVNNGVPLPNISRFNWKNGFYSEENH